MAGKYNYQVLRKYPHLLGEDSIIWDRFIALYPDRFDTVDYDVHVGSGISPTPETPIADSQQWRNLTRKRIDVIAWKNDSPTIIEVKRRVGLDTLGQILGYKFLYQRQHPDIILLPILVVTSRISDDDTSILNHYKVPFITV